MTEPTPWAHMHGNPAEWAEPPDCCGRVFDHLMDKLEAEARRREEQAVFEEAKRVITCGVERLNTYEDNILTVIKGEHEQDLVRTIVKQCREAIAAAACICPRIEVSTYGDTEPKYVPGRSLLCGVHGQGMSR